MDRAEDPFIALAGQSLCDDFASLSRRSVAAAREGRSVPVASPPAVTRLRGFDLLDQPVVAAPPPDCGRLLMARTTVPLRRSMIGRDVVVVFADGDALAPVIIGLIEPAQAGSRSPPQHANAAGVTVHVDGERHVIEAEREIVLRCGDASITLTRAGKVIIEGNYILSRSKGYNKIKGAAIDIN